MHSYLLNNYTNSEEFYCVDLTNILSENLTNEFYTIDVPIKYIEFTLNYNYSYLNSLNETYKQLLLNSNDKISLFYPLLSFSPNNYYNPFKIQSDFYQFEIDK